MPPNDKPLKGRITMTKQQRQTAAGIELMYLCEEHTADGKITHEEVRALDRWLDKNRNEDLPAIQFLIQTVDQIMADGVVTEAECKDLYKAMERVLPQDLRYGAISRRRQQEEAQVREAEEREAAAQRRKPNTDAKRAQMIAAGEIAAVDLNFHVAGVTHENRDRIIRTYAKEGDAVFLVRDHGNRYSLNAISIHLGNGKQIGYVPERRAGEMAGLIDSGYLHLAYIVRFYDLGSTGCRCAMIEGGLYVPHSNFPDAVPNAKVAHFLKPASVAPPPPPVRTAPAPNWRETFRQVERENQNRQQPAKASDGAIGCMIVAVCIFVALIAVSC